MLQVRPGRERGHANHGWLDTWHTFSFADYQDPRHRSFRALRVLNEDRVAPGEGFGTHPHRDMEIITYVLEGALEHRDSLGNGEVLRAGELQHVTAGTGITHSEFNPSREESVHLYQIWLFPDQRNLKPGYEQKGFPAEQRQGRWQLVVSPDGAEGSLRIHQDARLYLSSLGEGDTVTHEPGLGRHAWLQVLRGRVAVNQEVLQAGDGLAASDEPRLQVRARSPAEVLLFDLA